MRTVTKITNSPPRGYASPLYQISLFQDSTSTMFWLHAVIASAVAMAAAVATTQTMLVCRSASTALEHTQRLVVLTEKLMTAACDARISSMTPQSVVPASAAGEARAMFQAGGNVIPFPSGGRRSATSAASVHLLSPPTE